MDFPWRRSSFIILTYFPPLRLPSSYFMYKRRRKEKQEENYSCWIIFQGWKQNFFSSSLAYPTSKRSRTKTERKSMWLSRESKESNFLCFVHRLFLIFFRGLKGKRYKFCDIKTATTCWEKYKCLAMMEKSMFFLSRWVIPSMSRVSILFVVVK